MFSFSLSCSLSFGAGAIVDLFSSKLNIQQTGIRQRDNRETEGDRATFIERKIQRETHTETDTADRQRHRDRRQTDRDAETETKHRHRKQTKDRQRHRDRQQQD